MNMQSAYPASFDAIELRDVLGRFATGVAVVTTCGDAGAPVGLAVNSFASVSLEPPEILWSIVSTAPSRPAFEAHGAFAVNVMAEAAKEETLQFARPSADKASVEKRHAYAGSSRRTTSGRLRAICCPGSLGMSPR